MSHSVVFDQVGLQRTDPLFVVTQLQVIEKVNEHRTAGFFIFIDLKKAYDSVSRSALWRALQVLGFPPTLVQLMQNSRW